MYRVDSPGTDQVPSNPVPHTQVVPATDSGVVYTSDVGQAPIQMDPSSVVVMATMPHWTSPPQAPPSHASPSPPVVAPPAPPRGNGVDPDPVSDIPSPAGTEPSSNIQTNVATEATVDTPPQPSTNTQTPPQSPEVNTAEEDAGERQAPQSSDFKPAWEVDQLLWPEFCEELYSSESEYFRHAGQKLNAACRQGLRVLAVASSQAGEGCTTLAMCLARAVAAAGGRVALVDANLQHPAMSQSLGLEFSRGWQDAALSKLPLSEVAVVSNADGITLFPLDNQQEPLQPARVSDVLREASAAADLVILDVGPHPSSQQNLLEGGQACPVDAAIVVRDLRNTTERTTLETAAHLKQLGVEAVGIAENYAPHSSDAAA